MTCTSSELSWLAGLLEGEGSFQWKKNRNLSRYPVIQLRMTDEDVVARAYSLAGVGTIHGPYTSNGPGRKPFWMWCVQKQADAAGLMMTLYPLMGQRRQAKIAEILQEWRQV